MMNNDFFAHKASVYENDSKRVSNVDNIANAIIKAVQLESTMHLMDFGSGTGLLLERIAPHVEKITGVDISVAMIEQLLNKKDNLPCELEVKNIDLESQNITDKFDGIISSMTMHHIQDIDRMFGKFHAALDDGGFVAISDLDKEDGHFHSEDTGVHHFGFDRDVIAAAANKAGFRQVKVVDASVVEKPHGSYPVFLLTAIK